MQKRTPDVAILWQTILSQLSLQPRDIQTIHRRGSRGKWFFATVENGVIRISGSMHNKPSSTTSGNISESEFATLFPLYCLWKEGSISREEAKGVPQSWKSSYVFALIYTFTKQSDNLTS